MLIESSATSPSTLTEPESSKHRRILFAAGLALSLTTVTACGNLGPEARPISGDGPGGASPAPTAGETSGSILDSDKTMSADTAERWCEPVGKTLGELFPISAKVICRPSTAGVKFDGEGGGPSDLDRWLTVRPSWAEMPLLWARSETRCTPENDPDPTECISIDDTEHTLRLFRKFSGQVFVFKYHSSQDQLEEKRPALQEVANAFQP